MQTASDVIDQLVGTDANTAVAALRAQRPDAIQYAQDSYDALFAAADLAGLPLVERAQAAYRVALLEGSSALAAHYRQLLRQDGTANAERAIVEAFPSGDGLLRTTTILRHVDLLTLAPDTATPHDLAMLGAQGLNTRTIVTLSQLIAFISYQVRIVAALRLLTEQPAPHAAQTAYAHVRSAAQQNLGAKIVRPTQQGFTLDGLGWAAWLDTLNLHNATADQIAVLEESTPTAKTSPYYLLLVQDVDVLRARSRLYNAIMYGPRGLRRADRELAALAVSRVNGCPYCASIHAQRFTQLTKQPEIATRLWEDGLETALEPRARATVDFAVKLTTTPNLMETNDLAPLRQAKLSDWEILDLAQVVAMFAWANRLMQTLGEPVP